jgi:hypothetical protein
MNHANREVPLTQVCAEGKERPSWTAWSSLLKSKIPGTVTLNDREAAHGCIPM